MVIGIHIPWQSRYLINTFLFCCGLMHLCNLIQSFDGGAQKMLSLGVKKKQLIL